LNALLKPIMDSEYHGEHVTQLEAAEYLAEEYGPDKDGDNVHHDRLKIFTVWIGWNDFYGGIIADSAANLVLDSVNIPGSEFETLKDTIEEIAARLSLIPNSHVFIGNIPDVTTLGILFSKADIVNLASHAIPDITEDDITEELSDGDAIGYYAFVNPEITWKSPDKRPSKESCLSLPGISRCVERHSRVHLSCYKRIDMKTGDLLFNPEPMKLKDLDSFIVQHENDHLNGILIVNLPQTLSLEAKQRKREEERSERIKQARLKKKNQQPSPAKTQKLNANNLAKKKLAEKKAKRKLRTQKKQDKIRVEIEERYAAEKKGLFSSDTPPSSDAINETNSD